MGKVTAFLNQYKSDRTRRSYRDAVKDLFRSEFGEAKNLDHQAEEYFSSGRDYEESLKQFLQSIDTLAPKSIRLKLSAVNMFLIENDVELSQKFWRRLKRKVKGSRALTIDKIPSNQELKRIVMHLPIQGKALFLMLASSGMRIGECLQLTLKDIDLDAKPIRIQLRGEYTKTGNPRLAFISNEAGDTMREWLQNREQYIKTAVAKSSFPKTTENDRLFPFTSSVAYIMWRGALKKARLSERDPSTNHRKVHPHVLRKFFRTRLGAVIPVDVTEALMGHEGYLTEVYRRYSPEQLAEFYLKGEHALLVFTEAQELGKLREEIEGRNKQLQTLVNGLTSENLELKNRLSKVEVEITELKKAIEKMIE